MVAAEAAYHGGEEKKDIYVSATWRRLPRRFSPDMLWETGAIWTRRTASNYQALKDGSRLLSAYRIHDDLKVWVITEWDRSATTILLPEDY